MENLREQISNLIVFDAASNIEELDALYSAIYDRLQDGYKRLSDSYFTESEIKEIKKYGNDMLCQRCYEAHRDLKNRARENFKF